MNETQTVADFPRSPQALSIDWIATVLGLDLQTSTMHLDPIGQGRGMLGSLVRVTITDRRPAAPTTRTLVAKFSAAREEVLQSAKRGGTHRREIGFYQEFAGTCRARVPRCEGAWYDEESAEFLLLLEDIPVDTSVDQLIGLDARRAALVLVQLAGLHADWWGSETLRGYPWLPHIASSTRRTNLGTLASSGWPLLQQLLDNEAPLSDAERRAGEVLPARISLALDRLDQLPQTLTHSDLRLDNLLFTPDEEVVLVDWQGIGVAPPSWDLAYFLTQSLSTECRRANESALLAVYTESMQRNGVDEPMEVLTRGYADALWYGLVVASSIGIVSAPEDERARALARTMGRRALDALHDAGELS